MKLDDRERCGIINDLKKMQNLRECLDIVDIVVGFLSSSRDDASKPLKKYLNQAIRMKDDRFKSKKVNRVSFLKNSTKVNEN